jgi:hypothetical protein
MTVDGVHGQHGVIVAVYVTVELKQDTDFAIILYQVTVEENVLVKEFKCHVVTLKDAQVQI